MIRVRMSRRARRDLRAIVRFIARDDSVAARRWAERLADRVYTAAATPRGGRVVPEYRRDDVREVFVRAYRILYRVRPAELVVLAFIEGHQQLPADLDLDA